MAGDYTGGTQRAQYLEGSGFPIDTIGVRTLGDPTPAWVSLLADVDRLQWGIMTDWGHPSYFVSCAAKDGGVTGSPGSYAAVAATFPIVLIVPPRVGYAHVGVYGSGAINVKITNAHDTTGIQIKNMTGVGTSGWDEQELATATFTTGVDTNGGLKDRALFVTGSDPVTGDARTNAVACEVTITRADVNPVMTGNGGILWGLRFVWDRGPIGTTRTGTTSQHSMTV